MLKRLFCCSGASSQSRKPLAGGTPNRPAFVRSESSRMEHVPAVTVIKPATLAVGPLG